MTTPAPPLRFLGVFVTLLLLLTISSARVAAQDVSSSAPRLVYGGLLTCSLDKTTMFNPLGVVAEGDGSIFMVAPGIAVRTYDSQFKYSGDLGTPLLSDATELQSRGGDSGPTDMFGRPIIDTNDIVLVRVGKDPPVVVMSGRYVFSPRAHLFIPAAIALDKVHYLYVVDAMTATVQVFSTVDGHFVGWFFIPVPPGDAAKTARWTMITAYDKTQFYVGSSGKNLVEEVDGMSHLLHVIGAGPAGAGGIVKLAGIAVGPDRNLYVSDSGDASIKAYDQKGAFLRQIVGKGADDNGLSSPGSLAIDRWGRIYVIDGLAIKVYTSNGKFLSKMTSYSTGRTGEANSPIVTLSLPQPITVDEHGNLYVGEVCGLLRLKSTAVSAP